MKLSPTAKTTRRIFTSLAVAAGCTVATHGAVISLIPTLDNSIYSESNNSNALGGLFTGQTVGGTTRRALLEFDIAGSIPAGATIDSVVLTLSQIKIGPAASAVFELHPVLAAWGEGTSSGTGAGGIATPGDATWNSRLFGTAAWTVAGGDFSATVATTSFGTSNIAYSFTSTTGMIANVQSWLNSPSTNFGWIMKDASETVTSARELGSSESAPGQQPTLTVTYTVPEPGTAGLLGIAAIFASTRRLRSRKHTR